MEDRSAKALQTVHGSLPTKRDAESLQRALVDRLTLSVAIDIVSRLVGLFPNGGQSAGDEYIGGLAKVLMDYPASVSRRAADPVHGVARDTTFLPTVAVLIAWCERETAPMAEDYAAAKRIAERVEDKTDPGVTDRMRELAIAWKTRADPKAQKLTGQESVNGLKVAEQKAEANKLAMADRKAEIVAEYDAAGLRPVTIGKIPISIELARMLGKEPTRNRDEDAA